MNPKQREGGSHPAKGQIGIDCRSLVSGPAGIATYVRNLRRHIPELQCLDKPTPRNNFLWNQVRPPLAQIGRRWKIYHAPSYTVPLFNFSKLVLMVADISYLVEDEWYPHRIDPFRRWYYKASMYRADRIVVPSDFTKGEIVRLFPDLAPRIRRIHLGVSKRFRPDLDLARQARERFALPERFILHVGDLHPRRNLDRLLEASRLVGLPAVLVGKVLQGGEKFASHPLLLNGLSLSELIGVYCAASVLGYPSSYEGFGFPTLEAMACGLPVVAANRSCLPEVCGDAAVLVEPEANDLAKGLSQALKQAPQWMEKGRQRAAQFTWEKTARQTLEVYQELMSDSGSAS